ncbi:putative 5-formyltetrahydrofolate cyclo-ligase [Pelotomaculum sp. FP]|uniref:5-formyltetrahydrofolate cyclo-ligase n=1 Tax=Pelotomaculum sp. FP TaxID=261474 RepID=UPI001065F5B2|nr:5-formyltetrahydrofolate cyclo-ligase [Pelotomaculum sp. FP]TEB15025.1 putative 5-formyltetrahydrofolate cyclo-ligase [Pelotomaculum sp. FP]
MLKGIIRGDLLKRRRALTPGEVAKKSKMVIERLLEMEEYRKASTIMTYLHFRNEVETDGLIRQAMADGKRVVVPATDASHRRIIPSLLVKYPEDLAPGPLQIMEPKASSLRLCNPALIDLVIVPGVAFDLEGNRLGYGGGFYDRFLLLIKPEAVSVGLSFELQVLTRLERRPHDVPVNYLLTEDRVIEIKRS